MSWDESDTYHEFYSYPAIAYGPIPSLTTITPPPEPYGFAVQQITQSAGSTALSELGALPFAGQFIDGEVAVYEVAANGNAGFHSQAYVIGLAAGTVLAFAIAPAFIPFAALALDEYLTFTYGISLTEGALNFIAGAPILGGLQATLPKLFANSLSSRDPLVVDLTGNGLNLTSLANSNASFDYSGSGLSNPTGWIGSGSGLLVLPNAQGQVLGGQQLFGPSTGNGFTELAALDSNHDGVINSSDSQFANLKIWQDTNGDGLEQAGELETLTQAGIFFDRSYHNICQSEQQWQ